MEFLPLSFFAGILTILAPCVLPLLPIIIGGSLSGTQKWRPLIITGSLAASVVVFTLLLKTSVDLLSIDPKVVQILSGGLVVVLGLAMLFPLQWQKLTHKIGLTGSSEKLLSKSTQEGTTAGAVLTGVALGPVFTSCSPTFGVIVATVLPQSFWVGLLNLVVYAVGLSLVMLLIAVLGRKIVNKLSWAAKPDGWFRRILAALFILVGLAVMFGLDKEVEKYLLQLDFYVDLVRFEGEIVNEVRN